VALESDPISPGWYQDPWARGSRRRWDGEQWTEETRPARDAPSWKMWMATSVAALRIHRWLVLADGTALLVAALVLVYTYTDRQPVPGALYLVIAAAALLIGGQIWISAFLSARTAVDETRGRRRLLFASLASLPGRFKLLFVALAVAAIIGAASSSGSLVQGTPTHGSATCPWILSQNGLQTCVSRAVYENAAGSQQRLWASVLSFLVVLQCGLTVSEIRRREVFDTLPSSPLVPR
jgi:hypothetical protein